MVKNLPAMQETQVQSLGWEYDLEKEMSTHSNILGEMTIYLASALEVDVYGSFQASVGLPWQFKW